jgi:hypothetical protein
MIIKPYYTIVLLRNYYEYKYDMKSFKDGSVYGPSLKNAVKFTRKQLLKFLKTYTLNEDYNECIVKVYFPC